jgi:hypothetical protein
MPFISVIYLTVREGKDSLVLIELQLKVVPTLSQCWKSTSVEFCVEHKSSCDRTSSKCTPWASVTYLIVRGGEELSVPIELRLKAVPTSSQCWNLC